MYKSKKVISTLFTITTKQMYLHLSVIKCWQLEFSV